MSNFSKINVYLRACNQNKPNFNRPEWFNYEKIFKNLLDTCNPNLASITVCFDGNSEEYDEHFINKYSKDYKFRTILINTKSYSGQSYENEGSSKSSCLVSRIVKRDELPEDSLIYLLDNDYLHRQVDWAAIVLDLFNNHINENSYVSLFDHFDKYWFAQDLPNHFGMYKDLKTKIILSSFCHWREILSITSCWLLPKKLFDRDFEKVHSIGLSDNTTCNLLSKEYGTKFYTPIPSINCHGERLFQAPFVDWASIVENTKLL